MVKLIKYCLITVQPIATAADLHIRNPLFTRHSSYCCSAS